MKKAHADLHEDDWYIASDVPAANLSIKKEVTAEELMEELEAEGHDEGDD